MSKNNLKVTRSFYKNVCSLEVGALAESDWMPWMASQMTGKSCLERAADAPASKMRPAKKSTHGFTLLEILIALFIFTIVAIIMSHSLHTIFTTQTQTEKRATQLSQLQLAILLFSRDIEQTVNRPITNAKNTLEAPLLGTPTTLAFTHGGLANPTGEIQRSTLQRTSYQLDKNTLTRQTWNALDQAQTTLPTQRVLLTGIEAIHFDYLDEKGFMHNTWPPTEQTKAAPLPRAVRITLTITGWGKLSQLYLITGPTEAPTNA